MPAIGLAIAAALCLWPHPAAAAAPTLTTAVDSFIDANGNGVLDCGETVVLLATFATNNSGTPALTGTLSVPAAGGSGLIFQPGSVQIEPDLTVGCQATVVAGNSPEDAAATIDFSCPADPQDNNSWTVVVSYRAGYFNAASPSFTATAHAATSDGKSYDAAVTSTLPAATCSGSPSRLALAKTAAGSGAPGSDLLYQITVRDLSGLGDGGLQFVDVVPDHTRFDAAASSPGWACDPDAGPGALCRNQVGNVAPNGSLSRFFAVTIDSPLPAGVAAVANTACVREGPTTVAACASATTPTAGMPLLHLAKSIAAGAAVPGATLAYTLAASNQGNQGVAAVTLAEVVPANTTFAAGASSPGWSCVSGGAAGAACTLGIGDLAAGTAVARTFAVVVADPLPAGVSQIANRACARAAGVADACDQTVLPTAGAPALKTAKTVASGSAVPGSVVTYDLAVQNVGNEGATTILAEETVPANCSFAAGASAPGWACTPADGRAGASCTLALGGLAAGATLHAAFAVTVANPLPAAVSAIANTFCATAAGATAGAGADALRSCATVTTPALGHPVLGLTKSYGGGPVQAGATLVFDLAYANSGNQDAAGVALAETVPDFSAWDAAASSPGWTCAPAAGGAGAACTLSLGVLAAGASGVRAFAVQAASPLPAGARQIANAACLHDAAGDSACAQTTTPPSVELAALAASLADTRVGAGGDGSLAHPGDVIEYTLILANPSAVTARQVEVAAALDPNLALIAGSVTATAGSVLRGNLPGDTAPVVALPALVAGGAATIVFRATVAPNLPADLRLLSTQATITAANADATVSDDPETPAPLDPTTTEVAPSGPARPIPIPTLGGPGLAFLAVILAAGALFHLRRPAARSDLSAGGPSGPR